MSIDGPLSSEDARRLRIAHGMSEFNRAVRELVWSVSEPCGQCQHVRFMHDNGDCLDCDMNRGKHAFLRIYDALIHSVRTAPQRKPSPMTAYARRIA